MVLNFCLAQSDHRLTMEAIAGKTGGKVVQIE